LILKNIKKILRKIIFQFVKLLKFLKIIVYSLIVMRLN